MAEALIGERSLVLSFSPELSPNPSLNHQIRLSVQGGVSDYQKWGVRLVKMGVSGYQYPFIFSRKDFAD
jgi:hypothetical protein